MRRKDKEITDKAEIESIIRKAGVCRIGLSLNDLPYIVPVNYGYHDDCLYFHSAPEGKKIEMIKQNNNVCFEIDADIDLIKNQELPCLSAMKYRSVIGYGKAFFIADPEKKKEALNIIVQHYLLGNSFDFNEKLFNTVKVVKIEISSMTGKQSGY